MTLIYSPSTVISIPDVESHIQAELSLSPSPRCRQVGVPPKQMTRSGVAIPKCGFGMNSGMLSPSPSHPKVIEKHVQIFDSQPLVSPPSSASLKSRSLFAGLAKMRETDGKEGKANVKSAGMAVDTAVSMGMGIKAMTKGKGKAKAKDSSAGGESEDSDMSIGPSSVAVSSSVHTSCTPPTSVGSVTSALEKLAMLSPVDAKGKGKQPMGVALDTERCTCACMKRGE